MLYYDIHKLVKENTYFRNVLVTGKKGQVVAMCLPVKTDIGEEVHNDVDQVFVFVDGSGEMVVDGQKQEVTEDDMVYVPAGSRHNVVNTDEEDLKFYTFYAPIQHPEGTIHKTKEDAVHE